MLNINISSVDYVVFNVAVAERSMEFYSGTLGFEPVRLDDYRAGSVPFPSVRVNGRTILDFFPPEYHQAELHGNNVNHIAFDVRNTAEEIEAFLRERDVEIVRRMTENFAARGIAHSAFHVLDPDGNRLELHTYEPGEWYPRRGRDPLGRFLWLRRVHDKARAFRDGSIGEYIYPCPIDQGMMERWGVSRAQFEGALDTCSNDDALLRWATATIAPERVDAANSWLCVEKIENLDRQDREEGAFL